MTELITAIVPYISPAAFPTVVVVLGLFYIYRKIGNERKVTKSERDTQFENLLARVMLLENEIQQIKKLDLDARLAAIETSLKYIEKLLEDNRNKRE